MQGPVMFVIQYYMMEVVEPVTTSRTYYNKVSRDHGVYRLFEFPQSDCDPLNRRQSFDHTIRLIKSSEYGLVTIRVSP